MSQLERRLDKIEADIGNMKVWQDYHAHIIPRHHVVIADVESGKCESADSFMEVIHDQQQLISKLRRQVADLTQELELVQGRLCTIRAAVDNR